MNNFLLLLPIFIVGSALFYTGFLILYFSVGVWAGIPYLACMMIFGKYLDYVDDRMK